jgi:hypothetical protein
MVLALNLVDDTTSFDVRNAIRYNQPNNDNCGCYVGRHTQANEMPNGWRQHWGASRDLSRESQSEARKDIADILDQTQAV